MQVNILIPVHNRIDVTMECLACLERQTYRNTRIVVVDDGSTDGTYETIKSKYPHIGVLRGDGNLWWTGAIHLGVEHVLRHARNGDFVLSLNNDTYFEDDFIESLVSMGLKLGRAIVGSMEVNYRNRNEVLSRGVWLDWKELRYHVEKGLPPEGEICNEHINVLPGRGTLIPIEVFRKLGNYNKDKFPHYIADYEFAMRAFNAGFKLVVSYRSVIYARTDITTISIRDGRPFTLREAYTQFFSIKSDHNIMDHMNFVRLHCPPEYTNRHLMTIALSAILSLKVTKPIAKFYHAMRSIFGRSIA